MRHRIAVARRSTLTGNVAYAGAVTTGFVTGSSSAVLTIDGGVTNSGSGTAVAFGYGSLTINGTVASSNGIGVSTANTATVAITAATAINCTGGQGLVLQGTSTTNTVSGDVVCSSGGTGITVNSSATCTLAGNIVATSMGGGNPVSVSGTLAWTGAPLGDGTGTIYCDGLVLWTGGATIPAGQQAIIEVDAGGTLNLGIDGAPLNLLVEGSLVIQNLAGTISPAAGSLIRVAPGGSFTELGGTATAGIVSYGSKPRGICGVA